MNLIGDHINASVNDLVHPFGVKIAETKTLYSWISSKKFACFYVLVVIVMLPMELKELKLIGIDVDQAFRDIGLDSFFGDFDMVKYRPLRCTVQLIAISLR